MTTLSTDDDRIRELLADARHTGPIPDDVAARLDAALGELAGSSGEPLPEPVLPTPVPSPAVPDLAAARRRRTARNLLIAAAAVVVVGVGISRLDLSGVSSSADDSGSSADGPASASDAGGDAAAGSDGSLRKATGPTVVLDSDRFGHQVRALRLREPVASAPASGAYDAPTDGTTDGPADRLFGADGERSSELGAARASCDPASWGPGRRVKARYDGKAGVLIYRPAQGDTQVVELYLCGHDDPTRSITLPRR
ncbi:hypothetical protein [Nocardioides mangrovi]|uniref:DUF1707 domain-containing protein n=1 Tax=Nocardioides mangrovi TaxID=2874580 RepID=A0ABS7UAZ5_9ACTN|nr:hypothetical protein [Nocardioides mangrovi]MBZ5738175.1 hypothetical protein [Nocardioides mangrovi]